MNKTQRQLCWEARDLFFHCLDSYQQDISKCQKEHQNFIKTCPEKWIEHFNKKRLAEIQAENEKQLILLENNKRRSRQSGPDSTKRKVPAY